jgi:hypothetical protein
MTRSFALFLVLATVLFSQARPAGAQVSGRVLDSGGRPLPAVPVELWSGAGRVAVQPTASDGSFRFDKAEAAGAVRLSARMLGYSPVHREVSAPAADVTLELAAAVVELEGLNVAAAPKLRCPRREDREARDLWASVRTRYDHTRDTLGISFYARRYDATGPFDDVGLVDEESRLVRSWYGVQGRARLQNPYRTSPYPYGYPIVSSFDPAYAGWRYRELQSTNVDHFVDEEFGGRHTFSILARQKDAVVVGFCPARESWKGPSIEGMLTIGRDTSLVKAEWKFRMARATEEAGGEVVFVPRGRDAIPLLPAQSLYWRKIIGQRDRYFQRSERFATYEFLPPDTLPAEPRTWLSAP